MPRLEPDRYLDDLDPEQRDAVLAATGPVAIMAGAGTGKTRVISRRTAYAIATEVVPPDQALVVTFTDKAAGEMVARLRALGLPGVTARTFHAHALSQLRFFWPLRNDGRPLPDLLDSKIPMLARITRQLPGHYRFTPAKDIADEIEWAKSRRIGPRTYEREVARVAAGREPPIPVDLFVRTFESYERAKTRAGRIDFDDLLVETVRLLEEDDEAATTVRARKRWFSVDEYQDTNPLQQRLLELWLGDRTDLCVVGDVDQTIYTFTGASSGFLTSFAERHPGARVLDLTRNYRSTPEVLALANRLIAAEGRTKRLIANRDSGPVPAITRHANAETELDAVVAGIRGLIAGGTAPAEIAILVRINAQIEPLEAGLTKAGIAYQVRGVRFYDRPEVKAAIASLRRPGLDARGPTLAGAVRRRWVEDVGFAADGDAAEGREAQERQSALETLLSIVSTVAATTGDADAATVVEELGRRAAHERENAGEGVNLLTYHRAKGLEWDAVFLPMLEEGSLPIRQALDEDDALAEERRLLYVGLTRARVHLALSWASRRETRGRETRREPSRFLLDLRDRPARGERGVVRELAGPPVGRAADRAARPGDPGDPVFAALREWRLTTARAEGIAAFVIAHDSVLAAIAETRPQTLASLRRVKGMGPSKLEKYGDGILEVLARATA